MKPPRGRSAVPPRGGSGTAEPAYEFKFAEVFTSMTDATKNSFGTVNAILGEGWEPVRETAAHHGGDVNMVAWLVLLRRRKGS